MKLFEIMKFPFERVSDACFPQGPVLLKEDLDSSESQRFHHASSDREALLWYGKAVTLVELRRLEEALACFEEAIRLKPDYPEAWYGKAATLKKLKRKRIEQGAPGSSAVPSTPAEPKEYTNQGNDHEDMESRHKSETLRHAPFMLDMLDSNPFNLLEEGESLVVDGSNLVRHVGCEPHNEKPCSNPGRMWILHQLLDRQEKWERTASQGRTCFIVIDASLRHHVDDQTALESLIRKQAVIQMPPGHPSDHLILQLADETGAVVLSNDAKMRKDYATEYPWLRNEHRFMRYVLVSDKVKKIEYMRRPRLPFEQTQRPQGHGQLTENNRKAAPMFPSKRIEPTVQKEHYVLHSLHQMEPPVPVEYQSFSLRHRAAGILRQLGFLTNRNKLRTTCQSCRAKIDLSNSRVRFCYRCRAPIRPPPHLTPRTALP